MRNKNIHKGLAHISTFFFEISSYWMKQFLVLIGCLFVSHFCFSQNLDSKDKNLLQTLYDLEIGSDIKLLNNYFSELDLNVETMRPDQYRIMFHKEFAGMDSVRHEFSYLNNQLISYGISKGGLDKAASEELQNSIVTFLENYADVKMNVNEETLMDGHGPQLAKSFFLELETTHFGVSYSETYDGFLFSLGKQALHSSPIIVQQRDKENSNTAKHHRPFVAPKGIVLDQWHSLTAGSLSSLNRNSFTLTVYNKQDSPVAQISIHYTHEGNFGPKVNMYYHTKNDSIQLGTEELFHHRFSMLQHYGVEGNRLLVLQNIQEDIIFIHVSDLPKDMQPIAVMDYAISHQSWMYYDYSGIGLFSEPSDSSSRIAVIDESTARVKEFTGRIEGRWAEVILYEVDPVEHLIDPCYSEERLLKIWTGRKWTGWVCLLDDNGKIKKFKLLDAC